MFFFWVNWQGFWVNFCWSKENVTNSIGYAVLKKVSSPVSKPLLTYFFTWLLSLKSNYFYSAGVVVLLLFFKGLRVTYWKHWGRRAPWKRRGFATVMT